MRRKPAVLGRAKPEPAPPELAIMGGGSSEVVKAAALSRLSDCLKFSSGLVLPPC